MVRFCVCVFILISSPSFCQIYTANSYLTDFSGSIVKPSKTYEAVKGNPYLIDEWCLGYVINQEGKQFDVEKMRFNILQNRVEYEAKGAVYEPTILCKSFALNQPLGNGTFAKRIFKLGFPPFIDQTERTYYEVLYEGSTMLLKVYKILVSEYPEPLSMARILRFRQVSSLFYYLPSERKLVKVSKKTKEALSIWGDKKQEMKLFSDKIGMKKNCSENELINLCKYYDSLL